MNEKNARLLRQFIRFCGPARLPEYMEDLGRRQLNPIIRDMWEVFCHGTSGQRRALASQLRLEMDR